MMYKCIRIPMIYKYLDSDLIVHEITWVPMGKKV
jgi:hypothetical protein